MDRHARSSVFGLALRYLLARGLRQRSSNYALVEEANMLKSATLGVLTFIVASLQCAISEAGEIFIRYGWGSEIHAIGDVKKDSQLGQEMGNNTLVVAQKWDQFWLAVPLWCSGRQFIVHEKVDFITAQTLVWKPEDQSPETISKITGILESELKFPFYAYFPYGWLIIGGVVVFVRLISGRPPNKEFARLIQDDRYKQVLDIMAKSTNAIPVYTERENEMDDVDNEAEMQKRYLTAVNYLTSQGISNSKAERNLQFLIGYINSHSQCMTQSRT